MTPTAVVSRRGAERVRTGHPWIFRSDVLDVAAEPGEIVSVTAGQGRALGWATFSAASQIVLRMISRDPAPLLPLTIWLDDRLAKAAAYRESLDIDGTAWRVVNAESDGLPGVIVDRYGDGAQTWFVLQTLTQPAERWLDDLVRLLTRRFQPRGIVVRNDPRVRRLEALEPHVGVAFGDVPERIDVVEGGVRYAVDLLRGQKTGLFLDQRENHAAAARYTRGDTLDAFTYNGGFALQMARRADRVLALDSSASAVLATQENAKANGFTNVDVREANVFDELRELEVSGARFDTIALDPPAFAKNRAAVERAVAGYKEINLRALRLLRPGGHLITCSCSYNVDEALFRSVLQAAAADARADVWVVETRAQARDHPVLLAVPETHYLKCVILRKSPAV